MRIKNVLLKFGVMCSVLVTSGCAVPWLVTPEATETEYEICRTWQSALPTRSRGDTQKTQDEIGALYDDFLAACEGWSLPF